MAKFVLSDEATVNSYGFRVLTAGINLTRFLKNPVMLDQHTNNNASVVGRWKDIKVEGGQLIAEPDFDTKDPAAALLAGKVERGFIKGASIGFSYDEKDMRRGKDGVPLLTKCELMEASICAIPSNSAAVSLYSQQGDRIPKADFKLKINGDKKPTNKALNMDFLKQLIEMLGLPADSAEQDVIDALQALKDTHDAGKEQAAEQLVAGALAADKITQADRFDWLQMAKENFVLTTKVIGKIPPRQSLTAMVNNKTPATNTGSSYMGMGGGGLLSVKDNGQKADRSDWTLDDYRRYAPEALAADRKLYDRLAAAEYGPSHDDE